MRTFVFRCPSTGRNVQAWLEEERPPPPGAGKVPVPCLDCRQIHFIDPATDRVLPPDRK